MKQIEVSRGNTKMVTWTDEHEKIMPGNSIRFKGDSRFWNIDKVHTASVRKDEINRDWKVGGL